MLKLRIENPSWRIEGIWNVCASLGNISILVPNPFLIFLSFTLWKPDFCVLWQKLSSQVIDLLRYLVVLLIRHD
jgi:hypothetical protein